jgi:hypothetical protein
MLAALVVPHHHGMSTTEDLEQLKLRLDAEVGRTFGLG